MNPISIGGEIKITVDISDRLCRILDVLSCNFNITAEPAPQLTPAQPVVQQAPPQTAPVYQPVPPNQYTQPSQPPFAPPAASSIVPTSAVPTSAPTYQLDDLSNAAAGLLDQNPANMQALQELTARYGVQTLAELPLDRYGAFATDLRALGARI